MSPSTRKAWKRRPGFPIASHKAHPVVVDHCDPLDGAHAVGALDEGPGGHMNWVRLGRYLDVKLSKFQNHSKFFIFQILKAVLGK